MESRLVVTRGCGQEVGLTASRYRLFFRGDGNVELEVVAAHTVNILKASELGVTG